MFKLFSNTCANKGSSNVGILRESAFALCVYLRSATALDYRLALAFVLIFNVVFV
jgi:hypothetical protein